MPQSEDQQDSRGDGVALGCGAKFASTVLLFGHGQKDGSVADWLDHDEKDYEGSDQTLKHTSRMSRSWSRVHPCGANICIEVGVAVSRCFLARQRALFGLDRLPLFPLYEDDKYFMFAAPRAE